MLKDALRLKGIKENRILIGPKSVNIHLTNICNLNCLYCWFHSSMAGKHKGKNISFPVFKKIIDDCHRLGVESITFSGEGEPILHPGIKDMISYVKGKNLRLSMLTNATFGRNLLKHIMKLDSLTVNIATLLPEKYSRLQSSGCNAMNMAIENIIMLSRIKKRLGLKKPKIRIGFIINEENHSEVQDIFSFAQEYGLNIRFRLMKANQMNKNLIISRKSLSRLKQSLEDIIKRDRGTTNARSIRSILLEPGFLKKTTVFYPSKKYKRVLYFDNFNRKKIKCYMGWHFSHIDMEGNVRFCCQNPFLIAGNIGQGSFKEIWNSEKYMELRLECKSGIDTDKHNWMECRHCPFAKYNTEIERILKEKRNL